MRRYWYFCRNRNHRGRKRSNMLNKYRRIPHLPTVPLAPPQQLCPPHWSQHPGNKLTWSSIAIQKNRGRQNRLNRRWEWSIRIFLIGSVVQHLDYRVCHHGERTGHSAASVADYPFEKASFSCTPLPHHWCTPFMIALEATLRRIFFLTTQL